MSQNGDTQDEQTDSGESDIDAEAAELLSEQDGSAKDELTPPFELSKDKIFELLKNQRRRYVVQYLKEHEGPVELRDLAEQVAAWENDKEVGAITSSERKRVYVGLYQCHLKKMDDTGVVRFNRHRGVIELADNVDQLDKYLDSDDATTDTWTDYYLLLAGVSGAVLTLVGLGVYPLTMVPDLVWTVLIVGAFGVLAVTSKLTDGPPVSLPKAIRARAAGEDR